MNDHPEDRFRIALDALTAVGIMPPELRHKWVVEYGSERVLAVVAYARSNAAKNVGGMVRAALTKNWELPKEAQQ